MEQNIPRRLARFYRTSPPQTQSQQQNYDYTPSQEQDAFGNEPLLREDKFEQKKSQGIPSMDYSDVNLEADKRNLMEIKKLQEKNLVEKLALEEIEKFKVQNNRMPNQKEEEQIAENLFNQMKEEGKSEGGSNATANARQRGRDRKENGAQNAGQSLSQLPNQKTNPAAEQPQNASSEVSDIKNLFKEESEQKGSVKESDDLDLNLGEMDETTSAETESLEGDLEKIEDVGNEDKSICPNCKKKTEKIIYCSKCGTAFCSNCAKTQGSDKLCPKCQTKAKI